MSDDRDELFALAVIHALESKHSHGVVGRSTADGNTDVEVPGRPGYVYVELGAGEEIAGVVEAMNLHVPRLAGTPVRMMKVNAIWLITGLDYASERLGSEHSNVPPHVHTRDNGLAQSALDLEGMPSSLAGAGGQFLRVRDDEEGFFLGGVPIALVPYGTPSGEFDVGTPGEWLRDDDYVYFCYMTDTWARWALTW